MQLLAPFVIGSFSRQRIRARPRKSFQRASLQGQVLGSGAAQGQARRCSFLKAFHRAFDAAVLRHVRWGGARALPRART